MKTRIIVIMLITCIVFQSLPLDLVNASSYVDEYISEIEEDEEFPIRYYKQVKAAIQSEKYTEEEINEIIVFIEFDCDYTDKYVFWDDKYRYEVPNWTIDDWKSFYYNRYDGEFNPELFYDYYWNFAVTIPADTSYKPNRPTSTPSPTPSPTPKPGKTLKIDYDRVDTIINKLGKDVWKDLYKDKDVKEWDVDDWIDYLEDYNIKEKDSITLYYYYYSKKYNISVPTLSHESLSLTKGEMITLSVIGCDSDIIWKSGNKKVATVVGGSVDAKNPGITLITAKTDDNIYTCVVQVTDDNPDNPYISVNIGEVIPIEINGDGINAKYVSSNTSVVDVIKGRPTAIASGKATVTLVIGKTKYKFKVKVAKKDAPTNISYSSSTNKIRLEWQGVEGAYNYSVYMYDKGSKEYQLCGATKKTYYDIKNLEPDTKYYFKVSTNVKINGVVEEQKVSEKIECTTIENINGWITKDNKKYYYKKGFSIGKGLMEIKDKLYIFNNDGSLVTNKFSSIDGKKYYSDNEGIVICNKEVTDKNTGITYTANSKGVLTEKPFVPLLKDTNEYKVTNSYKYSSGSYTYLVYVVEAKKTTCVEAKLSIKDKNGDIYDTCDDTISLTKGKKNVFILQTYSKYVDYSYKYSFSVSTHSEIWSGDTDAVKVTHYNTSGKRLYITLKQTKEKVGTFAELKVLLFNNGNLVYANDFYYDVKASEMTHKGDEGVMDININGIAFDDAEFYYEDR